MALQRPGAHDQERIPTRISTKLPPTLRAERRGKVAVLTLMRAAKRNALDDPTVAGIEAFFSALPEDIGAVVLDGDGEHFSAGLDLSELSERDVRAGIEHSRSWHRAFQHIEFGKAPVVAVLHGAVIGGGLELAAAAHVRVAERSAFYALPEGSRGIYVGGGASVRLPALIGTSRVMEMMLTGRTLNAEEGHAIGLSHYLVENGNGFRQGPRTGRSASPAMRRSPISRRRICCRASRRAIRPRASPPRRSPPPSRRASRGQGAAQGVSGKARAEGGAEMHELRRNQLPHEAARRCGR